MLSFIFFRIPTHFVLLFSFIDFIEVNSGARDTRLASDEEYIPYFYLLDKIGAFTTY